MMEERYAPLHIEKSLYSYDRYLYSRSFSICDGDIQTVNTNRLVSWKGGSFNSHFLNMLYDIPFSLSVFISLHT